MTDPTNLTSRPWALLAALATAALGAALGGCAHDDYYCDNTGCYYCDGVGCRMVNPPSRTTCQGNWQCQANQTCTSAGCVTTCNTNSDCAQGWTCRGGSGDAGVADGGTGSGQCLAPTETAPTPNPGSCTSDANCPSGTVCLNGTCARSTTGNCTADSDCTGGNVCISGRCTPTSDTCQFNNQCGPGRVCVNSQCRESCATTSPACPTGEMCVAPQNYCAPAAPTGCVHDTDCASGDRCLNGSCLQACTPGTSTCATGLYCSDDGVCIPDTRPQPFCDSTHPCANGSTCVGGVCRVPCMTNIDCQSTDVSYRNCGQIPGMTSNPQTYCLTDDEFHPNCARQSDCSAGLSCIDGVCR